ncbi:hypothetical protein CPB86DRAFT_877909 [Serendipita vermifera]|nr:hypothetical protein CPB86DRAFT_877909 [Serendipita vermifera]
MPPESTEKNANHSAKLFGVGREPKRPGDRLVVTDETTAWEIYNHKASEVDREMIKDWNDSLNTLLIFTALYSAVLTAFIVESMKLLEEDPAETTRDILLILSRQLANSSFPPFEPTAYETPQYAIVVNGLFFTSLSCSLIAALLAVLALQWVANYDMGLNTSLPEKRALQRHIRFRGIEKWKMSELIASPPLLIFVALFLFFIGIADWLWYMNRAISGIVIGGIGIGCLLYTITNLISIVEVDAPFRTPISKELAVFIPRAMERLQNLIPNFSSTIRTYDMSDQDARHTVKRELTFSKREEKIFDSKEKGPIALDGLSWLANHIEISSNSQDTFIALIKGLTEVPAPSLMDEERMEDVPWKVIFEMLCAPYVGKSEYDADELERAMWICKGLGIIPHFKSRTFQRFLEYLRNSNEQSRISMAYFASYKQKDRGLPSWEADAATQIHRAFEHTTQSISQIGYNYLHFMLLNVKKKWPDMELWARVYLVNSMADAWTIPSAVIRDSSSSITLPTHSLQLILNLVIPGAEVDTIDTRYLAAIQPPDHPDRDRQWNDAVCRVLRMITQHLILQISHKYDSLSDFTNELKILSSLMDSKRLDLVEEQDNFIWVILNKYTGGTSDEPNRIGNTICGGLHSRPVGVVWVDLILTLDEFVTRQDPLSFHFYLKVICLIDLHYDFHVDLHYNYYVDPNNDADFSLLGQVRDPCLAWIASWHCPNDVQLEVLVHPKFSEWSPSIEQGLIRLFDYYTHTTQSIAESDARITFLRALFLDGPSNARIAALNQCYWGHWLSSDDEKCHRLFASPALGALLRQSVTSEEVPMSSILRGLAGFHSWFYDEFSQANGLDLLPLIAFYPLHPTDPIQGPNALEEILVDHILSSTANRDVRKPLLSSYRYLQSIGESHNSRDYHGRTNLEIVLRWVLNSATKVHDSTNHPESSSPLVFDPPILERGDWPTVGDIRSFDFVNDISDEEWEDWVIRLKVMIMGAPLGGLKPGPLQDSNRFCRDPDGLCGRI